MKPSRDSEAVAAADGKVGNHPPFSLSWEALSGRTVYGVHKLRFQVRSAAGADEGVDGECISIATECGEAMLLERVNRASDLRSGKSVSMILG